jgi:prepilin-type N-terminal cleavage/methylation domain-containing protein
MVRRGFTIVELLIVIAVVGILLLIAVVNLRGSQMEARDNERASDIASIAKYLESFYTTDGPWGANLGVYPSIDLPNGDSDFYQEALDGVDLKALSAPGIDDPTQTFIPATNNDQTATGVTPQPTIDQYVYQPIDGSGALCTSTDCRKFNLYYRTEGDDTIHKVTSLHQ